MSIAATVRALVNAGGTPAQIAAVVEAWEAAEVAKREAANADADERKAERRAKDAARKRVARSLSAMSANVQRTDADIADSNGHPSPPCSPPFPSPDPNPYPPYNPPQPFSSSSSDARALERECREIVGAEPVAFAQDFAALAAVLTDGVTSDDVIAGVRAAMGAADFRPRAWSQLAGWARRAAKDRLASIPKIATAPQARGSPPAKPAKVTVFGAMLENARQEAGCG